MYLTPQQLNTVVETVLGEAANQGPAGWAAVASVIANRAAQGWSVNGELRSYDPAAVARQPYQFSAWNSPAKQGNKLVHTPPSSPIYKQVAKVVQSLQAYGGTKPDPTRGATYFHVAGTRDPAPRGYVGTRIGAHVFSSAPQAIAPGAVGADAAARPAQVLKRGDTDGSTHGAVTALQNQLKAAGFNVGPVDGVYGPYTAAAVKAAQKQAGLAQDGRFGPATQAALAKAAPTPPAYEPGNTGAPAALSDAATRNALFNPAPLAQQAVPLTAPAAPPGVAPAALPPTFPAARPDAPAADHTPLMSRPQVRPGYAPAAPVGPQVTPAIAAGPFGADKLVSALVSGDPKKVAAATSAIQESVKSKMGVGEKLSYAFGGTSPTVEAAKKDIQSYLTKYATEHPDQTAAVETSIRQNPGLVPKEMQPYVAPAIAAADKAIAAQRAVAPATPPDATSSPVAASAAPPAAPAQPASAGVSGTPPAQSMADRFGTAFGGRDQSASVPRQPSMFATDFAGPDRAIRMTAQAPAVATSPYARGAFASPFDKSEFAAPSGPSPVPPGPLQQAAYRAGYQSWWNGLRPEEQQAYQNAGLPGIDRAQKDYETYRTAQIAAAKPQPSGPNLGPLPGDPLQNGLDRAAAAARAATTPAYARGDFSQPAPKLDFGSDIVAGGINGVAGRLGNGLTRSINPAASPAQAAPNADFNKGMNDALTHSAVTGYFSGNKTGINADPGQLENFQSWDEVHGGPKGDRLQVAAPTPPVPPSIVPTKVPTTPVTSYDAYANGGGPGASFGLSQYPSLRPTPPSIAPPPPPSPVPRPSQVPLPRQPDPSKVNAHQLPMGVRLGLALAGPFGSAVRAGLQPGNPYHGDIQGSAYQRGGPGMQLGYGSPGYTMGNGGFSMSPFTPSGWNSPSYNSRSGGSVYSNWSDGYGNGGWTDSYGNTHTYGNGWSVGGTTTGDSGY